MLRNLKLNDRDSQGRQFGWVVDKPSQPQRTGNGLKTYCFSIPASCKNCCSGRIVVNPSITKNGATSLVPGHGLVLHGRNMLTLFRDYLMGLNQLVRDGLAGGKSLAKLQSELTPERLHSLSNQNSGKRFREIVKSCSALRPGNRSHL